MRIWILALLPCALLAQTSPPRPAGRNAFRKLPQRLDSLLPGSQPPNRASSVQLFVSAAGARPGVVVALMSSASVCSIPLLRVPVPEGAFDRMSVPAPPADSIDHMPVQTPAVCQDPKP